jgi:hypothetical protein
MSKGRLVVARNRTVGRNGKESIMCYEYSGLVRKVRAAELLRKEREKALHLKEQGRPATPAKPAAPEPRIKERQTVPV